MYQFTLNTILKYFPVSGIILSVHSCSGALWKGNLVVFSFLVIYGTFKCPVM